MSSETHEIRLVAKDGASNVFRMTGQNADRMNQQIERSNQRSKRSYEDMGRAAQRAGALIGAGSILAINAANKSAESQARLKQSVENTGKSYGEYAKAIDQAQKAAIRKAFDDEDAADAMSKLTQTTNDAGKAIADLSIAEDIARARGISLASAADIVAAAEQGRIGALRRMGIAIDQNATKEEALAELQKKFAGQADAYANTNAATWDRYRIEAENALESVGAALGKHQGEILAVSAAWTAFGKSMMGALGAGGGGAAAGAGANPIGIAIAAIAASVAAAYVGWTSGKDPNSKVSRGLGELMQDAAGAVKKVTPGSYGDDLFNSIAAQYGAMGGDTPVHRPYGGTGHEAHGDYRGSLEFGPRQDVVEDKMRTNKAAGNYASSSDMGSGLAQQTQALKAQYGEWYHLADGVVTAKDALEGFQLAQDHVLKVEGKYGNQLSEYSGQLNSLQAAYDEVNAKKESGAKLTEQETKFMDGYSAANERLTGGVYDSTLAMGLQAEQYASNMTAADEFKSASAGVTGSINDLITALYGIPGYVKTTVEADTSNFWAAITPLLGQQIGSAFINVYANRIGFGATPEQHGGLVMAQHGYGGGSRDILVGEAGPEIMTISGGSAYVMPSAASRYSNKRKGTSGGGGDMHFHGGITIVANNPKQFGDQLRSYALAGSRT